MFSTRFVVALALLAAVAALPTDKPFPQPVTNITEDDVDDAPWFTFPLFGNLFAPLWRLLPSFGEIGPKIVADDNKFQVVVNVKDYKKNDLKVKVKGDFIFVQGSHEAKHDDHDVFASQFFHTYTLPTNSSGSDVSADLSTDGFLVVTAPLNGPNNRAKESDREVPIVETGVPYQKEDTNSTNVANTSSTNVEKTTPLPVPSTVNISTTEDDRKEPTTPPQRDEITEKDNDIPHGNEITP